MLKTTYKVRFESKNNYPTIEAKGLFILICKHFKGMTTKGILGISANTSDISECFMKTSDYRTFEFEMYVYIDDEKYLGEIDMKLNEVSAIEHINKIYRVLN